MTTTTRPGRYRDAFAAPEFRSLFGALVVSMLGYVVAGLALTVLVYRQTASPLLSALTFTMAFLPYLFGGTLLSGLVDRVPPRRLLAGCDLGSAAIVAVMTLPGTPVPALFALLFAMSLLTPLAAGARGALVADVLPPAAVVPARSLLRMVSQGAQICGYAIGGGLLAVLSPRAVLGGEIATFAASALVLRVSLRRRPARGRAGGSLAGDSLRGVAEVLRNAPLRRVMFLGWLVPFVAVCPEALAAPSVAARGLPSSATGWWLAAGPLGTVAGEVAGIYLIPAARRGRLTAPLAACGFLSLLAFALHPRLVPAALLLGAAGLSGAYMLGLDQLLLDVTPPELLGRAYAVNSAGLMTTQGLGFAAAGALGEAVRPDTAIVVAGVAGLAVVALCRPRPLRRGSAAGPGPRPAAR
ncbi:MFS transporter [Actinomadura sp. DC4]|uniref:MFS transporter n=1 Tax=Actinomadura sp. DC4 TaxID=3055069 RepID=UPI0025B2680E|nr:MFS transporter [Actinomadura sp. DC4]MDN3355244.1 MFS transporter [Actinomadura sp. DC4]